MGTIFSCSIGNFQRPILEVKTIKCLHNLRGTTIAMEAYISEP